MGQNEHHPIPEILKTTKQLTFPEKNTVFDWICKKQSSETWIPWTQAIDDPKHLYTKVK